MSINWIKITDRAREGINIINALPHDTFCNVLQYVDRQMQKAQNSSQMEDNNKESFDVENGNALEELERIVNVERPEFLLLIKTVSYILRRINTYVIKPSLLQAELRDKLHLQEQAKIDAFVALWVRQNTPIMNHLASAPYEESLVTNVAWKLNVQISSTCQQRDKTALGLLQLKTYAGNNINWEMNHEELLLLNQQLECIQGELNTILPKQT